MNHSKIQQGVQEIYLDDWREYIDLVVSEFGTAPAYVYRGQANYDWPILSSLDRHRKQYPKRKNLSGKNPPEFDCPPLTNQEHLEAFKRALRGRGKLMAANLTDNDYWAIGQHHGLKTPLVDFSRSPLAALFFAFEEERIVTGDRFTSPEYRGVIVMSTSVIEPCDSEGSDNNPQLVSPLCDENARLLSQSGLFLRMPEGRDLESYVRAENPDQDHIAYLIKVKIPNKDRDGCLAVLNRMNVHRMSLFPDIDGAAHYINALWQPGHEDSIAYF